MVLITFTLRHLRFGHMADTLCVLFVECVNQANVDEFGLSARMFLIPPITKFRVLAPLENLGI
jgi:hypothetical protein